MKYSRVEWIGEIPDKWNLVRLKDICINKKEVAGEKSSEYERLALTLNGVIKRPKDDQEGLQPKEFDTYQILEENDFVFKMIDLQNISTSRVGLSPYTGLVSPAYIRFASKKRGQFNEYIHYYLLSLWHNCVYNNIAGDGVRSALNATDMGNLKCPYPTEDQQRKIASFLNKKTDEIDSLIEIENQQIEKLKEYKQSCIDNTISNLNDDVRIKYVCILNGRIGFRGYTQDDLVDEGDGAITISPSNMQNLKMNYEKCHYLSWFKYNESPEIQLENGDILFVKTGSTYGKSSLVDNLPMEATINPQLLIFKKISINNEFFLYALQTSDVRNQIEGYVIGGTIPTISQDKISRIKIKTCSPDMQIKIVEFLNQKCILIDTLIERKNNKIELLEEYKKSIIYEYVTGKKEVC